MPAPDTQWHEACQELEFKFKLSHEEIDAVKRLSFLKHGQTSRRHTRRLKSVYFDTPDFALMHRGVGLRVRHYLGRFYQSVKSMGASQNGLHRRLEWEDKIASETPDFKKLCHSPFCNTFISLTQNVLLQPLFETDVKRTSWTLDWNGALLELALDIGALNIENKSISPIQELEVELKSGTADQLNAFISALLHHLPLTLEHRNKAEIGYGYYLKQSIQSISAR